MIVHERLALASRPPSAHGERSPSLEAKKKLRIKPDSNIRFYRHIRKKNAVCNPEGNSVPTGPRSEDSAQSMGQFRPLVSWFSSIDISGKLIKVLLDTAKVRASGRPRAVNGMS